MLKPIFNTINYFYFSLSHCFAQTGAKYRFLYPINNRLHIFSINCNILFRTDHTLSNLSKTQLFWSPTNSNIKVVLLVRGVAGTALCVLEREARAAFHDLTQSQSSSESQHFQRKAPQLFAELYSRLNITFMTSDCNFTSYQVIYVLFRFYIHVHEYLTFLLEMNWSNVL